MKQIKSTRILIAVLFAPLWCCAQTFTITTVAGSSASQFRGGFSGDGGLAINAELSAPNSVTLDSSGNLYICDSANNRIRKVSTSGIIATIAGSGATGTGSGGYSGDGGLAISALLNGPSGLAVDANGNLFIADTQNNVIRKVSPSGIISTFAGNGTLGFSGDGNPAVSAQLNLPDGVAVDPSGNVYIADTWNGAIRMVSTNGVISTFAGTGGKRGYSGDGGQATAATLSNPSSLAFDASGNLYIGDDSIVRKVALNGIITTAAGNGTLTGDGVQATSAAIDNVGGIAIDASGNLFISDSGTNRVRQVLTNGTITTAAGNGNAIYQGDGGLATNAGLQSPFGLAASGGIIYVCDFGHNLVRLLTPGAPAGGPAPSITKGGVVTSASTSSTIEPGSWVSIYGTNLTAGSAPVNWNGDYPLTLGGTTVTINGRAAFLSYVSPTQVNLQAPSDGSSGTVGVTLTTANGTATSTVTLGSVSPAFSLLGDGKHAAAIILRSDGSGTFGGGTYDIVGPLGTSLGYQTIPAKAGDNVVFFGVGFGPTNPPVPPGSPYSGAATAIFTSHLSINGQPLTTTFAGISAPGLFQFNVTIPQGLGTGDQLLLATVNGISTQANVVTTLQ
ncbi:MAG: hypothetical protein ABSF22_03610 [Bryobacteraceae bacterium]